MFLTERLISLVAPHTCLLCGREGKPLCEWCQADHLKPLPSSCYRCHAKTQDFATCKPCRSSSKINNLWVISEYHEVTRQVTHAMKFRRNLSAARLIGQFLDEQLPHFPSSTLVTHVPTATVRRRQRGYDQAELIARTFAKRRGIPHKTLLARSGQARQVGAKRKDRKEQLRGAFRVTDPASVIDRQVLLIDDITTTGATLEEAAKIMREAGSKRPMAAVFAQKL